MFFLTGLYKALKSPRSFSEQFEKERKSKKYHLKYHCDGCPKTKCTFQVSSDLKEEARGKPRICQCPFGYEWIRGMSNSTWRLSIHEGDTKRT